MRPQMQMTDVVDIRISTSSMPFAHTLKETGGDDDHHHADADDDEDVSHSCNCSSAASAAQTSNTSASAADSNPPSPPPFSAAAAVIISSSRRALYNCVRANNQNVWFLNVHVETHRTLLNSYLEHSIYIVPVDAYIWLGIIRGLRLNFGLI
jgi:hypothetical protein